MDLATPMGIYFVAHVFPLNKSISKFVHFQFISSFIGHMMLKYE